MVDHTKITLCVFIFTMAFFNPFGIFTGVSNSFQDYRNSNGRNILNTDGKLFYVMCLYIYVKNLIE